MKYYTLPGPHCLKRSKHTKQTTHKTTPHGIKPDSGHGPGSKVWQELRNSPQCRRSMEFGPTRPIHEKTDQWYMGDMP